MQDLVRLFSIAILIVLISTAVVRVFEQQKTVIPTWNSVQYWCTTYSVHTGVYSPPKVF